MRSGRCIVSREKTFHPSIFASGVQPAPASASAPRRTSGTDESMSILQRSASRPRVSRRCPLGEERRSMIRATSPGGSVTAERDFHRVPTAALAAFGASGLAQNVVGTCLGVHLFIFYTDAVGLAPLWISAGLFVA